MWFVGLPAKAETLGKDLMQAMHGVMAGKKTYQSESKFMYTISAVFSHNVNFVDGIDCSHMDSKNT